MKHAESVQDTVQNTVQDTSLNPGQDTVQAPIRSGFGAATTAKDVIANIDLTGKIAIVTGGYAGIGLETTRALASAGATVIVPVRNTGKAREAVRGIPRVELETLDLMNPASIDAFAQNFLAAGRPLHLLINNAGLMTGPLSRDSRGYESRFSTNHLGHFQLTAGLWPALLKAEGARVVAVSSRVHRLGGVDFEDPNFERREYDKEKSYAQSKSANALFAVALDKRGREHGVRAFAVHPGLVPHVSIGKENSLLSRIATRLSLMVLRRTGTKPIKDEHGRPVSSEKDAFFKNVAQGAATSVWCAVSPQLAGHGGVYCEDADIAEAVPADSLQATGVRPWAIDPEQAERLWRLSEKLTGVTF